MFAPLASEVGRSLLTYPPFLSFAASTAGLAAAPFTYAAGKYMAHKRYSWKSIGKRSTSRMAPYARGRGVAFRKRRRTYVAATPPFKRRRLNTYGPKRYLYRPRALKVKDVRSSGTFDSGVCSISLIQRRFPRVARNSLMGQFIRSDAWTFKKTGNTAISYTLVHIRSIADIASLNALEQSIPNMPSISAQRKWLLKTSQTHFEIVNVADIPMKLTLYFFMNRNDTDNYYNVGGVATVNPVRHPVAYIEEATKNQTTGGATGHQNIFGWDLSMANPQFRRQYKTVRICNFYIPGCQSRSVNLYVKHNKICNSVWNPDQAGARYTTMHIAARARTTQGRDNTGNDITFEEARYNIMGYTKYHFQAMENRQTTHQIFDIVGAGNLAAFPDPQDESVTTAPVAMAQ